VKKLLHTRNIKINAPCVYKRSIWAGNKVNKRAQRALGRSPEANVKGQGEAIYRGPLMLSTKYW